MDIFEIIDQGIETTARNIEGLDLPTQCLRDNFEFLSTLLTVRHNYRRWKFEKDREALLDS